MTTKSKLTVYWIATAILALVLASGGLFAIFRVQDTVDGMTHLGYPLYFITLLGIWKTLGALAILVPGLPRLKEWAYAGAVFELTGGAISHAAVGDGLAKALAPALFAVVALVSWSLRTHRSGASLASR